MSRPEVIKLARLLGVDDGELAALERVPAEDVRALREQVTDRLFDPDADRLKRLAETARMLPVPLVAQVGRRAFGPILCARLAGLLEPERAVDVASRWPDEFAAAIAAEMDPRRASDVVAAMPPDRIVALARVLAREGEHVAMGRFVGHLSAECLRACVEAIDERSLLLTAYVLEGADRIDEIVGDMPDERLATMTAVAADEGLQDELDHLRGRLSRKQAARLDAALQAAG